MNKKKGKVVNWMSGLCGSTFSSCVINCNTNEMTEVRSKGNDLQKVIDKGYEISDYVWQLFPKIEIRIETELEGVWKNDVV